MNILRKRWRLFVYYTCVLDEMSAFDRWACDFYRDLYQRFPFTGLTVFMKKNARVLKMQYLIWWLRIYSVKRTQTNSRYLFQSSKNEFARIRKKKKIEFLILSKEFRRKNERVHLIQQLTIFRKSPLQVSTRLSILISTFLIITLIWLVFLYGLDFNHFTRSYAIKPLRSKRVT